MFYSRNFWISILFLSIFLFVNFYFFDKGDILLLINQNHQPILDVYFKFITLFGDGLIFLPLAIIFLFVRFKYAILTAAIFLLHGLPVVIIKNFIAPNMSRPKAFFTDTSVLHFIDGVYVNTSHSFPSGHTTTAFAVFFLLHQMTKHKTLKYICVFIAFSIAISRVYLLQHFAIDVIIGAFIGYSAFFFGWFFILPKLDYEWAKQKIRLPKTTFSKVLSKS